jgi:hypothetical protein
MRRSRWIAGGALAAGAVITGLGLTSPARAQDQDLDELRSEIPEANPGEWDLDEADITFRALVEAYGRIADVGDFGDGSQLTGPCGGWAFSYDGDGQLIDAAFDAGNAGPPVDALNGGQAFTSGNPFEVDTRGVVAYYGFAPQSGDGPLNHRWEIVTSGISIDKGGDPNTNAKNRNTGLVDLGNDLPFTFSAKVKVSGELRSDNLETCVGLGHVKFKGNGLTDPVGLAALALLGGGFFGLLFNARPASTWKG